MIYSEKKTMNLWHIEPKNTTTRWRDAILIYNLNLTKKIVDF